jgi:hypothetical protein
MKKSSSIQPSSEGNSIAYQPSAISHQPSAISHQPSANCGIDKA